MTRWTWLLAIAPLAGCPPLPGVSDWQPVSYVDEGEVCFSADGTDVTVDVVAPDCLSSSCSRDLGGSCEAVVDGTDITLTSEVTWEQDAGTGIACTDDCGIPMVTCTIADLADGTYTVTHGTETLTLTVPVEDGDDCLY
ncbi:MAG: hypothetical protein KTR31_30640 [Myxococcales bacterium]|nr:hypothetical protein [Myxococcales bacterium]